MLETLNLSMRADLAPTPKKSKQSCQKTNKRICHMSLKWPRGLPSLKKTFL